MPDGAFWQDPAFWVATVAAVFTGWQAVVSHQARKDAREAARAQEDEAKILAEAAARSAKSAEESASVAREGLYLGQRPWMTVEYIGKEFDHETHELQTFIVTIRNGGTTPAENVRLNIEVSFPDLEYIPDDTSCYFQTYGHVGPGATVRVPFANVFVSGLMYRGWDRMLYVVHIVYSDVFQKQHEAVGRFEWLGSARGFRKSG